MVDNPLCESCGAQTKELFEKGSKWVCNKCKKPRIARGHIIEARPPITGRGKVINHRGLSFSQSPHPDGMKSKGF